MGRRRIDGVSTAEGGGRDEYLHDENSVEKKKPTTNYSFNFYYDGFYDSFVRLVRRAAMVARLRRVE